MFVYLEEKSVESIVDAKIYNEMTTVIPPESISVPLILHGILEQVCLKIKLPLIYRLINSFRLRHRLEVRPIVVHPINKMMLDDIYEKN